MAIHSTHKLKSNADIKAEKLRARGYESVVRRITLGTKKPIVFYRVYAYRK